MKSDPRLPPEPGYPPVPDDTHAPVPAPGGITFEQIRERAYELWERNHRPEGFEIEFWLLAERELRKERERRTDDEPAPSGSKPPR
ncbi:DUF2934 domain-containing protein [Methylobacterium mesophilicum]|uniref:DUF2934 domain-containing protein n=1 Tax=Methylobacterium mesophilicum TaxID=39956 RepID=UPI0002C607B3